MDPQDDPEARIRELERPLEDVARELGTGEQHTAQYGAQPTAQFGSESYPPPPPPPPTTPWPAYDTGSQYGNHTHAQYDASPYGGQSQSPYSATSYPPMTPQHSSGVRPWALVVGVAVLGLIVIAGAFAWIGFNMTGSDGTISSDNGSATDVLGGGGSIDKMPSGMPSVSISVPSVVVPTIPGDPGELNPQPGQQVSISGIGENKSVACNDSSISISGISNTITVTGHCLNVTVSGMQNVIIAEDADVITASGVDNKVTYRNGAPDVHNSGVNNIVEQG